MYRPMYVQACVCAEKLAEYQKSLSTFKRNRDLCCLFPASSSYFLLSECSVVRVGSHLTKAPGAACSEDGPKCVCKSYRTVWYRELLFFGGGLIWSGDKWILILLPGGSDKQCSEKRVGDKCYLQRSG